MTEELTAEQKILLAVSENLKKLDARLAAVEQFITPEKLGKFIQDGLTPLVQQIDARFGNIEKRLTESGQSGGGGFGGFLDGLGKGLGAAIQKRIEGGGGVASGGLSEMDKYNLNLGKMIQNIVLRKTLKDVSVAAGVPISEQVEHIVVEGAG